MNFPLLLDLTLRGSLVLLPVLLADTFFASGMNSFWRRVWWLLVPLAFLAPVFVRQLFPAGIPVYHGTVSTPADDISTTAVHVQFYFNDGIALPAGPFAAPGFSWLVLLWLAGATVALLRILIATWRVQQQWKRERFSTDPALLNLLEDAKAAAGIAAPIGLIVSDRINAPALLGWLRPRILLPTHLANGAAGELKAVLLHELAHFKSLDIPGNWLFAALRVVHWFNPLAYLDSAAWGRFVEEAADENAIRWMDTRDGTAYGEILLKTLGNCPGGRAPYGALAIGESITNLKRRIRMIRHYPAKSNRGLVATAVMLAIAALLALAPTVAVADDDPVAVKKAVTDAMQPWLTEIDSGDYAKSWTDSAQFFQKAITSDKWVAALTSVRTPLGKSVSRKLDTVDIQTTLPGGSQPAGTFAVAQFDSSFDNMKYARETVSFQKEGDGVWRAVGYYIKPQ